MFWHKLCRHILHIAYDGFEAAVYLNDDENRRQVKQAFRLRVVRERSYSVYRFGVESASIAAKVPAQTIVVFNTAVPMQNHLQILRGKTSNARRPPCRA